MVPHSNSRVKNAWNNGNNLFETVQKTAQGSESAASVNPLMYIIHAR